MGLLDGILAQVLQGATNDRQANALPGALQQILGKTNLGSMGGLLALLQQSGLDRQVASWLSNGPNMPVDRHQLQSAIGDDHLKQMSGASGLTMDDLLKVLVQGLPPAVDRMSPNGALQEDRFGENPEDDGGDDERAGGSLADQAGLNDIGKR